MTAARGVSGDVSTVAAGRKAGREKAGHAAEGEGFAAAMRGLGSARDDKSAATVSSAKAKPTERSALQAGRQGDFARQHATVGTDRGEGKAETRGASRLATAKDEGAVTTAEAGETTAGRRKPARVASAEKPGAVLDAKTSGNADTGDAGAAEGSPSKAKAETVKGAGAKGDGEAATSRGRRTSRTEEQAVSAKSAIAAKEGAGQVEGADVAAEAERLSLATTKDGEAKSENDLAPRVDGKGRQSRLSPHERLLAELDPELRRLRILQAGAGDEVPAVELQLSAEAVAERLGVLLPGEVDEKAREDVAPARPRSGRIIVTVGRGDSYAVDPVDLDEASAPARATVEAGSSAQVSPDAKLAAILGGFSLESRIVAATAAEAERRPSEFDHAGTPFAAQLARAGDTASAAKASPTIGDVRPQGGSAAAAPVAARTATSGVTRPASAETPQAAATTSDAAGRASFTVPERRGLAAGTSDLPFAGRAAAASSGGVAGTGPATASAHAAGAAVDATRMTTVRLPEQPGSPRSLGLGARVDLVSMRTDFEPATRRSERAGRGDASAGRTGPSTVEAGSPAGTASARSAFSVLGETLSATAPKEQPFQPAPAALQSQAARQSETPAANDTALAARAVQADTGNGRDLGDLPGRRTPTGETPFAAAANVAAGSGLANTADGAARGVTPTVAAAVAERGSPADRAAPAAPPAAKPATGGRGDAPASFEQGRPGVPMPASGAADGRAAASTGADGAVTPKSAEAPSGGMPARAPLPEDAGRTSGLPHSRGTESSVEGRENSSAERSSATTAARNASGASEALPNREFGTRQSGHPGVEPGRPSDARESVAPTGRRADAIAAANGVENSRHGVDPIASGDGLRAAVPTDPRSAGAADAGSPSAARHERDAAGIATSGESAPRRADLGGAAPVSEARAPSRPSESVSSRNDPAPEGGGRNAPVTGEATPAKTAASTTTESSLRAGSTATGHAAFAGGSPSAVAAPVDRPAEASSSTRIRSEGAAATAPAGEPAQGMQGVGHGSSAEPLRPAVATSAPVTDEGDRGQHQQQQPRAVDRPAAAMPTDEARGPASRAMPVSGAQPEAAATTPAASRSEHPVAAEPTEGMQGTEPTAEPLRSAASSTVPAAVDRAQRPEQRAEAGERPGMPPLDELARTKPLRQPSSQSVRSEEGTVAASRQGMLSAPTAQVADALATALVRMDPAANAPAGADRTRLRAGGAALKTIQIQLAPEKLGKVNVTLKLIGDNLAVHIEASEPETAHRLKDDGEGLKSLLKSAGFDVDEAIVTVGARDAAGTRAASQPGVPGDASASGQSRGEGSASGQFASDGQAGQGARREEGRQRGSQVAPGARSVDGAGEAGGRNPGRDPSFYL
ncbi:flagellar hook-length control protein FliK [Jiella avicenniae]|uniref:Flagellar hook-length control protein FliK n=1 Tax=Jiella avicenniae TaxID=2907202 RepID=A0A9X1NXZ5_9HYPH|nr:flagellar hook-length control protein FliK [Jiella avicenniae]MCE7026446.1 flagellar hook-length control protein FliK [Jiella avicenniae]